MPDPSPAMFQAPPTGTSDVDELGALRTLCWRQAKEISALGDTIAILRGGSNRLAADNAIMSAQLAVYRPE